MSEEQSIYPLLDLINKIIIFLSRPAVQLQLLTIVITLLLAGFLSRLAWRWMQRRLLHGQDPISTTELEEGVEPTPAPVATSRRSRYWEYGLPILAYAIFPIVGLIGLRLAESLLQAAGGLTGLVVTARTIFRVFLFYRLLIGALYTFFPTQKVRRYQVRLLGPLFAVFIFLQILGDLTDLNTLGQVVLTRLFESPITTGALFLATVGLYFWIDATLGLHDISYHLITRRTQANPGSVEAGLTLARYALIIIGVVIVFSNLNIDPTTLAAITGGLSVGIGFGLKEVLTNFISGILILTEGSLRPGDLVEFEGELCRVERVNIRSTTVLAQGHVEVIIPNQHFFTSSFRSYTGSTWRPVGVSLPVGASYSSDPEQVIDLLVKVAKAHPDVLPEPGPSAALVGFGESSLNFRLGASVRSPLISGRVVNELNRAVWHAFAEHGIEMPFPQRDLHIRSGIPWQQPAGNSLVPVPAGAKQGAESEN